MFSISVEVVDDDDDDVDVGCFGMELILLAGGANDNDGNDGNDGNDIDVGIKRNSSAHLEYDDEEYDDEDGDEDEDDDSA